MAGVSPNKRDNFGSKFGVIAAAAGSAVGLGNIWKFPYELGNNGGGAFLVFYLIFVAMIGIPVMIAEFTIGRNGQKNPIGSFKFIKPGKPWFLVGVMGVGAAFMIFAFYGSVAGWTLEYLFQSFKGGFEGKNPDELNSMFTTFVEDPIRPIVWQVLFVILTTSVVIAGVKNGIEKYTKILMPVLVVIILILVVRSVTLPGAGEGLKFLFKPDFSKINATVILSALGQAFFSLSLGMGTIITYGSYINRNNNLGTTAIQVSIADTLIAILAGVAIFPAVFAFGINPSQGEGLIFVTIPTIFEQMPGGYFFSILFFILLAVAALTSTISLLEVIVSYFSEEYKISRKKAALISSSIILVLGILCTMSNGGVLKDFKIFGYNIWGLLEFTSADILLPLGGFFIVIFVGFFMGKKRVTDELTNNGTLKAKLLPVALFLIRFVAPVGIALVFLNVIGLLKF
ncbi:MAG: sodium-dependent transporter [Bacteroidales bacterium]|nr:sodium-dependent transporter [Bacteroidales bacterium]